MHGSIHHYLRYNGNEIQLIGYTDFDWGGSETDGRSTTGGCFSLGSSMVSWMSRKQDHVDLSSVEFEYVATCEVGKEVVSSRKLMSIFFGKPLVLL